MGAYNEVRALVACPSCHQSVEVDVQFKYGAVVHRKYALGDKLDWGANDIGTPGLRSVVVDGEAVGCSMCRYEKDWPVYVFVEHDVLKTVKPADGTYDFVSAGATFIELRDG